jgi:hypothetical protein
LTQTSTKRRNIIIASAVIGVLLVCSVFALIEYNQLTSTRISLSLSKNQINVLQGSSSQIQVDVDSKGNPENATLTALLNSTSIQCSFAPATGKSSFISTITINVPDSTPSENYSLTVKASGDTSMAHSSCMISVLSKNVTVSGKIQVTSPYAVNVDSLQFKDTRTMAIYTVNPSFEDGNDSYYSYNIILNNEETYNITVNFQYGLPSFTPFSANGFMGNLTVFAPAERDTMQNQDFTYNHLQ